MQAKYSSQDKFGGNSHHHEKYTFRMTLYEKEKLAGLEHRSESYRCDLVLYVGRVGTTLMAAHIYDVN